MRGRIYKRRETGKHGRRLLLAGLLVASGPFAMAEMPVAMVPLPLTPLESGPAGVRTNPFCQPVAVETESGKPRSSVESADADRPQASTGLGAVSGIDRGVALASGADVQQRSQSAAGGEGLRAYLQTPVIETAGGVRANPLASQFKTIDPPEPMVDVAGVRALRKGAEKDEKASGISFSFSDEDSNGDPVAQPGMSEPIEFSFSDDSAIPVAEEIVADSSRNAMPATGRPITRPAAPWPAAFVERAPSGLPEPVNLRALEPAQFSANRILQVPTPEPTEIAAEEPVVPLKPFDVLALPPDDGRLVKGGHPRVEVGRPTVAVDRLATMSLIAGKPRILSVDNDPAEEVAAVQVSQTEAAVVVDATDEKSPVEPKIAKVVNRVTSVVVQNPPPATQQPAIAMPNVPQPKAGITDAELAQPEPAKAEREPAKEVKEAVAATFNLRPTEVRAVKMDSTLVQVQSDNMAVCAAIQVASGQVQLIATGAGRTHLSVRTVGQDGVEKTDRYEVIVGEVRASAIDSPESIAMTLTQTVQSAFPGSNILVSAEAGRLIVTGSCPDEDSARRMLRMIRSACASPVIDRVKVR